MLLAFWPTPVLADTVITAVYPSFNSTNIGAFQLNGDAGLNGNRLRLTPVAFNRFGASWWQNKVSLADNRSFSTYFRFEITAVQSHMPSCQGAP